MPRPVSQSVRLSVCESLHSVDLSSFNIVLSLSLSLCLYLGRGTECLLLLDTWSPCPSTAVRVRLRRGGPAREG